MTPADDLEELLANALAAYDRGGQPALDEFVQQHADHRARLLRGIDRCRKMGLLGPTPARDFPEQLGDFRLLRRLGGGGMGVVYEAEQISLGRRVALKVIRPELLFFEGARERFRREIEAVARLSHPAVVPVLASGEQDGVPYYVMELLAGRNVAELCQALAGRDPALLDGACLREQLHSDGSATDPFAGPWWTICVRAAHAVAAGVRHAHLRGIVHRDIKPSNVMLTPHGNAVLLDFGVASMAGGREFTRSGQTPGSPAFMSPEQLRGHAVDERTDVYSLGATLWQLLTLRPPFKGVDDLPKIRDGEVPPLRAHNRAVPPELAVVVHKAMDRDRERRYPDMEAFAADLQAVLQRRPIAARRLGVPLRLWRWGQRHRVAATAMIALLASAAAMPAVVAWRMHATNAELAAAKAQVDANLIELGRQKAKADDSLDQALHALDAVLLHLAEDELRFVPAAERVTLAALDDAVAVYRRLLLLHPDSLPLRDQAAAALGSLAAAQARAGQPDAATAHWREAIAHLQTDGSATSSELVEARAYAAMNLGNHLLATGEVAAAAPLLDDAERDFLAIAELAAYRATALRGRSEICVIRCRQLPRADRAGIEHLLRESLELVRHQLALEPGDVATQGVLVTRLDNLATHLAEDKRRDEALAVLDEAATRARALPTTAHIWPPPRLLISNVLETQGNLFTDLRDRRAAAALQECLELREQLVRDYPANVELRTLLAGALTNLGRLDYHLARDASAVELYDRAAAILRGVLAESPRLQLAREFLTTTLSRKGTSLAKLGDGAALAANGEAMAALDSVGALRTAARHFLRALEVLEREPTMTDADRQRGASLRQRALDCLLRAEQIGWGTGSRLDEPLYEPLRSLPEFAALQQRVAERLQAR